MKALFPGYYRFSSEEMNDIWDQAIFIFDANVLLNLYRYPVEAREDLIKTLKKIEDRIWLPHQVVLEYQINRIPVILEQLKRFDDVKTTINRSFNSLRGDLEQLQLRKRHATIDPEPFLEETSDTINSFLSILICFEMLNLE